MNLSSTIEPSSTQLNADDLISGSRTITITKVWGNDANATQPVSIGFEGDNGRPYLPSKGMRRIIVALWGVQSSDYIGRSLTLFCDPSVSFGGIKVGGIRISHASHIDGKQTMALTVSRARRAPFTVDVLRVDTPPKQQNTSSEHEPLTDDALEVLFVTAKSTAQGGMDQYKAWFMSLSSVERGSLLDTIEPDRDDFDKEKSVHDACKGVAEGVVDG